jgi:hypothetical protein
MKENISVKDVCELMNEMLEMDYSCTYNLVSIRVDCNEAILNHPTIQVQQIGKDSPKVGILGILNGLFGVNDDNMGSISMMIDNGKIVTFLPTGDTI